MAYPGSGWRIWVRAAAPVAGPGGVRAACGWSAMCDYWDRSAPAVPSATWKIAPSWWIDPRDQGSRYHEGKIRHVNRHRSSLPQTHRAASNPGKPRNKPAESDRGVNARNPFERRAESTPTAGRQGHAGTKRSIAGRRHDSALARRILADLVRQLRSGRVGLGRRCARAAQHDRRAVGVTAGH